MFYVIAFDPIEVWVSYAPQNIHLNPSFVKDSNVVGKEMTRNGRKMANFYGCLFFGALVYTSKDVFKFSLQFEDRLP